jgi:carboxypeptidase C (cathepsin A)
MPEEEKPTKSAEIKVIKQTSEVTETTSAAVPARDDFAETKHAVTIAGREIKYTALAGTMILREEAAARDKEFEGEKARAKIFFVAYTKDDVEDKSNRPITFCFNGGPGSSSVWLHLGLLGS